MAAECALQDSRRLLSVLRRLSSRKLRQVSNQVGRFLEPPPKSAAAQPSTSAELGAPGRGQNGLVRSEDRGVRREWDVGAEEGWQCQARTNKISNGRGTDRVLIGDR